MVVQDRKFMNLRKAPLDEIELFISILKSENDKFDEKTNSEIASIIQSRFGVLCTEREVFLLHEPTIDNLIYDSEYFYRGVLGIY